MESQILQAANAVLSHQASSLEKAVDTAIRELKELLRLDAYHRHGHDESELQEALGPFGSANLDLSSLSETLSDATKIQCLEPERLQRVSQLLDKLETIRKNIADSLYQSPPSVDLDEDASVIHQKAETHFNQLADIFRDLRMAQLEIRSKYDASRDDAIFEGFNWRDLGPVELKLCPPFIVHTHLGSESGPQLRKVLSLLESQKPITVVATRSSLRKTYSPTADPRAPANLSMEMLPLAMRGVYFLQTCIAAPDVNERIASALGSPRPTVLSLLAPMEGESEDAFSRRAARALGSRSFPDILYNPDLAQGFVSCFDLSANPEGDKDCCFADFAAAEKEFAEDFSDPIPGSGSLVPVADYLKLTRHQRVGKSPCVYLPDDDERPYPKIVSQAVVSQAVDQRHIWQTLQELAGTDNPHVQRTQTSLQTEFDREKQTLEAKFQEEMAKAKSENEKMATASAVRNIVAHFTGVAPGEIDINTLMGARAVGNNGDSPSKEDDRN